MNRWNKAVLALAIGSMTASQRESTFTIKNYRSDMLDAPVTIDNLHGGKRGKKGKSLKDWN